MDDRRHSKREGRSSIDSDSAIAKKHETSKTVSALFTARRSLLLTSGKRGNEYNDLESSLSVRGNSLSSFVTNLFARELSFFFAVLYIRTYFSAGVMF